MTSFNLSNIRGYLPVISKALVAAAAACTVTAAVLSDGNVDLDELVTVASAWSAVFGVYKVTNAPAR